MHETNSHAASKRGATAFAAEQYDVATAAYKQAHKLRPSAQSAFNLGTSEIAAGDREQGSALMAEAIKDPALRADALYNRGNSALASQAFDHAIRDYSDALRLRPDFAAAKRNLEIAQIRKESARQSAAGQQQGSGGKPQQQPQTPAPGRQPAPPRGEADMEALLRSVQQQEQEEMTRMKRMPAERRVGW